MNELLKNVAGVGVGLFVAAIVVVFLATLWEGRLVRRRRAWLADPSKNLQVDNSVIEEARQQSVIFRFFSKAREYLGNPREDQADQAQQTYPAETVGGNAKQRV